ncbi:MAG TPA: hypothetical protein VGL93_11360 [Streptosporangiaceae bacterium]|jgi:hypothetical protein
MAHDVLSPAAPAVTPPPADHRQEGGVAVSDGAVRRITATTGFYAAAMTLIEVPMYLLYSGPPTEASVLGRSLFGMIGLTFLAVFMVGLRSLLGRRIPGIEPAAGLASAAGLLWVAVEFVSTGLEAGASGGTYVLYGAAARLIEALFLVAFAYTVLRTRRIVRWTAWSALALAAVNLAFVPSIFFGDDPADFYAANGWGTTALTGTLFMLWLLATSLATFHHPRRA